MIKDIINRITLDYSMNDNAGVKLYVKVLQRLGYKPVTVYSPNGAADEYYNIGGKTFNVSYFSDGAIAIASYLKTA